MKRAIAWGMISCALCAVVCWFYLQKTTDTKQVEPIEMEIQFTQLPSEAADYDAQTIVRVQREDSEEKMTLHDYLVGVLLAEVPASFEPEALKAQAVAARTYTLKQMEGSKHQGALCTKSSCCQAWTDEGDATEKQAMGQAVAETDGCVITYDGELIDAVFFSCSGGKTEAAAEVWGGEVPYLQSVDSPGEEDAAPFSDSLTVSAADFIATIHELNPDCDLSGSPATWFDTTTQTAGDGVATIQIGAETFTGKELRTAFSLRSTMFRITVDGDQITFHTLGYGHRVGMSQYGANARAKDGTTYQEIIAYYYQGTEIETREPS